MNFPRKTLLAVLCLLSLGPASFGQGVQPSYLFAINPAQGSAQNMNVFSPSVPTFGQLVSPGVPVGTTRVLPRPDGQKFYFLSSGGVFRSDVNFGGIQNIGNIPAPATAGVLTPAGDLLVVGAGRLYFFETNTDQILNTGGTAINGTILEIVNSLDSRRVFVLSVLAGQSLLSAFDTSTRQQVGQSLSLPGDATGMAFGPNNRLYVTARNRLFEIDPATVAIAQNGEIGIVGRPVSPTLSPDGRYLVMVNSTPLIGGASVYSFDTTTRQLASWPQPGTVNTAPNFDRLIPIANNKMLVYSQSAAAYFDVGLGPLAVAESSLQQITSTRNVVGIVASDEVPTPRYVFLLLSNGPQTVLQRVDLQNNTVSGQVQNLNPAAVLQFAGIPPTGGAAQIQKFNEPATVLAGTANVPLVARVLDAAGRPVRGVVVTFQAEGITFNSPTATTNAEGFAFSSFTAPTVSGQYTINATAPGVQVAAAYVYTVQGGTGGGGGGGSQGGIFIQEGNGQLVLERNPAPRNFRVIVRDAQGRPVSGEEVRFEITQGRGSLTSPVQLTDANGEASCGFIADTVDVSFSFQPTTVRANSSRGSVEFKVTTFLFNAIGGTTAPPPLVELLAPSQDTGRLIQGRAGETITDGIRAVISAVAVPQAGQGIANVGVRFENFDNPDGPAPARCASGEALSDAAGLLRCDVILGCTVGQTNIRVIVGEYRAFPGLLRIQPGAASRFSIIAGNNQSGRSGDTLQPFIAQVTDGCGSPLQGVAVEWRLVSGSGQLVNVVSTSDSQGRVSARLTLGATPGAVQVRVSLPGSTTVVANFAATINITVAGSAITAGNNQSGLVNQNFPQQLEIRVFDQTNNPVANFPVTFAVSSGSATVNPASTTTDAQGRARTTVAAGPSPGDIVVTATAGSFVQTFNLSSRVPGPTVLASSFTNAASGAPGLVPCGLASVFGTNLASSVQGIVPGNTGPGPLPLSLAGVELTVNGVPAPIHSVSNVAGREQVNFQTPCETAPGLATVVIRIGGGTPTTISGVPVFIAQPGVFEYTAANGRRYAAVLRPDGSWVSPENPARAGETLRIIVTGLGVVNPVTGTNRIGIGGQLVPLTLITGLNNAGVRTISGEYSALGVGLYAVNFEVPASGVIGDISVIGTNVPLAVAAVLPSGEAVFGNSSFVSIVP